MESCHRNLPLNVQQTVKSVIDFYWNIGYQYYDAYNIDFPSKKVK